MLPAERIKPKRWPTGPYPPSYSLVVLGGSRVAAVNNVTSAGVLVLDAGQSIENNL